MATKELPHNMMHHDDALGDLGLWPKREVLRIEALSKRQVLCKLQGIMEGQNYSWHCINELLQVRFNKGNLEFTAVDRDVLFE
jgi:hypothetical protein